MRWKPWVPEALGRLALLGAVLVTTACTSDNDGTSVTLSTHCGVDEVHYDGEWYERVGGRLDDGSGNPPPGWDNPEQEGTVARLDDSTIVFSDSAGHREVFQLREGATEPKRVCA